MWQFLIGMIVGCIIGVFLIAMISAAPDIEEDEKDNDEN